MNRGTRFMPYLIKGGVDFDCCGSIVFSKA